MMSRLTRFAPALLLFLPFAPLLHAEETTIPTESARHSGVFTFYFENDVFAGEDRHYTNGLKLSWLTSDLSAWGPLGWHQKFADALPFMNRPDAQKNFGFAFGQNMYTPQDTQRVPPDPTDRPYAGWTYLEFSAVTKTASIMDTFALQVGMVGRHSYAQDSQQVVHEWLNSSRPRGWNYQIHDEVGVNLVYERQWRLYARSLGRLLGVDFTPRAGVSLGNVQTFANAGVTARLGFHLPSDFGVSLIGPTSATNSPLDDHDPRINAKHTWSLFAFGGVNGKAVARDIFLDGNTFRDSASVDREDFVADLFYGIGIVKGRWQLTYTQAVRTKEFKGQHGENRYGSVALSRTF